MQAVAASRRAAALCLAAACTALALGGMATGALRRPYFLDHDPEYAYLLNALNLLELSVPGHFDHPGTPLQAFGAVVLLLQWLAGGAGPAGLAESVLLDPERYLAGINVALNLLVGVAAWFAARALWLHTGRLGFALMVPLALPCLLQTAIALGRVTPEPMLVAAALAVFALALPASMQAASRPGWRHTPVQTRLFAAALGVGIAVKVTFAPVLAALWLLPRANRRAGLVWTGIAFVAAIIPVLPFAPRMAGWFASLALNRGHLASGTVGLPDPGQIADNFAGFVAGEPALFGAMALLLVGLVIARKDGIWRLGGASAATWSAVGLAVGLLQLAISVKHGAPRYLLGATVFDVLVLVALAATFPRSDRGHRAMARVAAGVLVTCAAALAATGYMRWEPDYRAAAGTRARMLAAAESRKDCLLVHYSGSGSQAYAMAFGDGYARRKFAARLGALYADATFYDIWQREFYGFDRADRLGMVTKRITGGGCVLMHGMPLEGTHSDYGRGMELERLGQAGPVATYRLLGFSPRPGALP